jgi:hypothetical protein
MANFKVLVTIQWPRVNYQFIVVHHNNREWKTYFRYSNLDGETVFVFWSKDWTSFCESRMITVLMMMIIFYSCSTPLSRMKLHVKPPMPYRIWTRKLGFKVSGWYKIYIKSQKNPDTVSRVRYLNTFTDLKIVFLCTGMHFDLYFIQFLLCMYDHHPFKF